ncbi:MAG: hypothetical protein WEG40_10115 [Candidatus Rokuibacteriota bacterium]
MILDAMIADDHDAALLAVAAWCERVLDFSLAVGVTVQPERTR